MAWHRKHLYDRNENSEAMDKANLPIRSNGGKREPDSTGGKAPRFDVDPLEWNEPFSHLTTHSYSSLLRCCCFSVKGVKSIFLFVSGHLPYLPLFFHDSQQWTINTGRHWMIIWSDCQKAVILTMFSPFWKLAMFLPANKYSFMR